MSPHDLDLTTMRLTLTQSAFLHNINLESPISEQTELDDSGMGPFSLLF